LAHSVDADICSLGTSLAMSLLWPVAVATRLVPWGEHLTWTVVLLIPVALLATLISRAAPSGQSLARGTGTPSSAERVGVAAMVGALFFPLFMLAEARGTQLASFAYYGRTSNRKVWVAKRARGGGVLASAQARLLDGRPVLHLGQRDGRFIVWEPADSAPPAAGEFREKLFQVPSDAVLVIRRLNSSGG